MSLNKIKRIREAVFLCNQCRCGTCGEGCPMFTQLRYESVRFRGKMAIVQALLDNVISPSPRLKEIISLCTTCGNCRERCPNNIYSEKTNIDSPNIIETLRNELVKMGFSSDKHERIAKNIQLKGNPYGENKKLRTTKFRSLASIGKKNANFLYFIGCTATFRTPEIALATIEILKAAKLDFTTLGADEGCCGSVLFRTGYKQIAKKIAKREVRIFEKIGAKSIITSCAGCYRTFKLDYPKIVKFDFEVIHITELIAKLIRENKLKINRIPDAILTYHDPCHLGRHCGIYDSPREILKQIPGIQFVEMPNNKNLSKCCGAGGGVMSFDHKLANLAASDVVKTAKQCGANILVSSCPFCVLNLEEASKNEGLPIDVTDITTVVSKSLKSSD